MRISLVSFADGEYLRRGPVMQAMAEEFGRFERIEVHSGRTLPRWFIDRHGTAMEGVKKYGFCIWKPLILLQLLERIASGECALYIDAGFTLNPTAQARFDEYLEIVQDSPSGILSFQNGNVEAHWCKTDVATRLGLAARSRHMLTAQLGSGLIFVKKTSENVDLVRHWAEIAVEDNYHYSDDTPSIMPNHPQFQEHRTQSIYSLLCKMRGVEKTHYEVQSFKGAFDRVRDRVPFLATRSRS